MKDTPPSLSLVPESRLVRIFSFLRFSSKARLTSAGAQETFNLASFLELREESEFTARSKEKHRDRSARGRQGSDATESLFTGVWVALSRLAVRLLCHTLAVVSEIG